MPGDTTRHDTECYATQAHEAKTEWWAGAPPVPHYVGWSGGIASTRSSMYVNPIAGVH
jgi:hypothetical protein